jgi:hypothetical protein
MLRTMATVYPRRDQRQEIAGRPQWQLTEGSQGSLPGGTAGGEWFAMPLLTIGLAEQIPMSRRAPYMVGG